MSVHFTPKDDTHHKNETVTHTKAFCSCYDGSECSEKAVHSEPGGRVKKGLKNLTRRQKLYDDMRDDARHSFHHTRRPGSVTK